MGSCQLPNLHSYRLFLPFHSPSGIHCLGEEIMECLRKWNSEILLTTLPRFPQCRPNPPPPVLRLLPLYPTCSSPPPPPFPPPASYPHPAATSQGVFTLNKDRFCLAQAARQTQISGKASNKEPETGVSRAEKEGSTLFHCMEHPHKPSSNSKMTRDIHNVE